MYKIGRLLPVHQIINHSKWADQERVSIVEKSSNFGWNESCSFSNQSWL